MSTLQFGTIPESGIPDRPDPGHIYHLSTDGPIPRIFNRDWPGGPETDVPLVLEPIAPAVLWAAESGNTLVTRKADPISGMSFPTCIPF